MANSATGFTGVRANHKFLYELLVEMKPSRDCTKREHLVFSIKPSLYGHEAMFEAPNVRNNLLVIIKHQNHTQNTHTETQIVPAVVNAV